MAFKRSTGFEPVAWDEIALGCSREQFVELFPRLFLHSPIALWVRGAWTEDTLDKPPVQPALRHVFALPLPGERMTIGRMPESHLVITDQSISRRHAEFVHDANGLHVRDLGSKLGTRIEGERIEAGRLYPVRPGMRVELAYYLLRIFSAEQIWAEVRKTR
jgi:hypothetical protein